MRSMTGFGQGRAESGRYAVAVTLRAVNGRFLDLALRLRDEYRACEAPLRELLSGALLRGRVEVAVDVRPRAAQPALEVREELVRGLYRACRGLIEEGLVSSGLTLGDLLRLPEVLAPPAGGGSWEAQDDEVVLAAVRQALDELQAARGLEGGKLQAALGERLDALAGIVGQLDGLREVARQEVAAGLRRRLEQLLGDRGLDETRLAFEVALLAERSDVGEEMDRLRAHLAHFRQVMAEQGALGKRLDFLVQEIFRELSTLGAKCRHGEVTRLVLDAKVLAEQLREQVQNVE